jgi:hypothetical protein
MYIVSCRKRESHATLKLQSTEDNQSMSLFAELKRRNVFRVGAAYLVGVELAATLHAWGEQLAFLEANGHATGVFRYAQASHAALSDLREMALSLLAQAINAGFRDPLLGRAPAFEPWHDDAEYLAAVARMRDLINLERAKLDMAPLQADR